jgi:NAD(P)H dehydrogenase (quinone)
MASKEKYLVTTATGKTGYQVARQLLENGRSVRVMSRSQGPVIKQLEGLGAELTLGELGNEEDMQKAVSGVQRVYYSHPFIPGLLNNTVLFARIAKAEKIEAVVNLGQYLSELKTHPSRSTNEHKQGYEVLNNANIGASHVTPGWFADNVFTTSLFITQLGRFPFPLGEGKSPVVSNEDIAAVAVAILQDPTGHEGKRYQPTGPKAVGTEEMLQTFSRVLGRKVKTMPMPPSLFSKAIMQMGMHPYLLSQLTFYLEDFKNKVFDYEPNDVVEQFTGRPAEDFEVISRRYFEQAGLMEKTVAGQWRAMQQFIRIGLTKAPSKRELMLWNT